uniref:Uncharacterized protein n=1 Tax=Arundo donax TaxID=35708 RepID=A0A0A9C3E6_ARUDO
MSPDTMIIKLCELRGQRGNPSACRCIPQRSDETVKAYVYLFSCEIESMKLFVFASNGLTCCCYK